MVSITSEIASLDSSIPPRTHCSAATSWGGVRSKLSPRGAISATLTGYHLPWIRAPLAAADTVASPCCSREVRQFGGAPQRRPIIVCTGLWTACADTPPALCAAWGYSWGRRCRPPPAHRHCLQLCHPPDVCGKNPGGHFPWTQRVELSTYGG